MIVANDDRIDSMPGPKTGEGKEAVSKNARKHGYTARRHFLLPGEDQEQFETELNALRDEIGRGELLDGLTFRVVKANLVITRIETEETGFMSRGEWEHPRLALLNRYKKTHMSDRQTALNTILAIQRLQERLTRPGNQTNRPADKAPQASDLVKRFKQEMRDIIAQVEAKIAAKAQKQTETPVQAQG